jgi:isopenicillin-N N-acyltransferase-like protein
VCFDEFVDIVVNKMSKVIECRGTSYEVSTFRSTSHVNAHRSKIGLIHGSQATIEIERAIAFYTGLFKKNSNLSWPEVIKVVESFEPEIRQKWPRYHEELQGIADGSKRNIHDIVALNVRTEIAFGLMTDGCTSLFWETPENIFLGQNWDV